ncbi:MAG: phage tail assembly chaperone [Robiginitomaculum sp.]|nr:MAG: phage tail assembly chaperone [Robiginitomaculum sp.]
MMPWRHLLFTAQHGFGLTPAQFWALSVLEWRCLQSASAGHADQACLRTLMTQYPD